MVPYHLLLHWRHNGPTNIDTGHFIFYLHSLFFRGRCLNFVGSTMNLKQNNTYNYNLKNVYSSSTLPLFVIIDCMMWLKKKKKRKINKNTDRIISLLLFFNRKKMLIIIMRKRRKGKLFMVRNLWKEQTLWFRMEIKLNFVTNSNFDKVQFHFDCISGEKCLHVFYLLSRSLHFWMRILSGAETHMQIGIAKHWFDRKEGVRVCVCVFGLSLSAWVSTLFSF